MDNLREQIKDFEELPLKSSGKIDLDRMRHQMWIRQQFITQHVVEHSKRLEKVEKKSVYGVLAFVGVVGLSSLVSYHFWGLEVSTFVALGGAGLKFVVGLLRPLFS